MANFAQIDDNNVVIQVVVINNNELLDSDGNEQESLGIAFCKKLFGTNNWKQTSYNGSIRKNYAGIGYTFDEGRDAFIAPQPYPSWTLNEDTCQYECPVAYPDSEVENYVWNEEIVNWELVE